MKRGRHTASKKGIRRKSVALLCLLCGLATLSSLSASARQREPYFGLGIGAGYLGSIRRDAGQSDFFEGAQYTAHFAIPFSKVWEFNGTYTYSKQTPNYADIIPQSYIDQDVYVSFRRYFGQRSVFLHGGANYHIEKGAGMDQNPGAGGSGGGGINIDIVKGRLALQFTTTYGYLVFNKTQTARRILSQTMDFMIYF